MRFEKLVSDIENYKNSSQLSIEQVIGMVQDLCKDLGTSIDQCKVEDTDDMIRKLNWLSNQSIGIFKQQNSLIEEHRLISRATKINDAVTEIHQESNAILQAMQEKEQIEKARQQERMEAERIEEEIHLLQKELEKEKINLESLRSHMQKLQITEQELQAEKSKYEESKQQYMLKLGELDSLKVSNDTFQKDILNPVRLEIEELEQKKANMKKEFQQEEEKLEKARKQIDDLVFALASVRNDLTMKDSQRQQAFSQYEQKQLELDSVIEKQNLLRRQIKDKQQEIDKIKEENARWIAEDIPASEDALQRQRDVQEAQKKTVRENQAILEQLEKEIATLGQWITQTEISFKEKNREKEKWQERKEQLAARKEALNEEIAGLNEACQSVQKEIHQLEDILRTTQPDEILRKRQQQKQEMEALIEECRQKKEEIEAENIHLSEKEKEINVLRNDIIIKKSDIQKADAQLNRIRQDAETLQRAIENLSKEEYIQQVEALKEKRSFLMEVHTNLKKDFQAYGMYYETGQFASEEELVHILKDMSTFLNSYSNHIKSCLDQFSVRTIV